MRFPTAPRDAMRPAYKFENGFCAGSDCLRQRLTVRARNEHPVTTSMAQRHQPAGRYQASPWQVRFLRQFRSIR